MRATLRRWLLGPATTRSQTPPGRYLLVYDDGCGFCLASARWLLRRSQSALEIVPCSEARARGVLLDLQERELWSSAHLVTPDGVEHHGGSAVTRALRLARGGWIVRPLDLPGIVVARELGYALVARNRHRISRVAGARCDGDEREAS